MNDIDQAVSDALEIAALKLQSRAGNKLYRRAWEIAAGIVREMKPRSFKPTLIDKSEQITSTSTRPV